MKTPFVSTAPSLSTESSRTRYPQPWKAREAWIRGVRCPSPIIPSLSYPHYTSMVLDHLREKVHRREKVEVVDCAPVPVAVPGAEPVAVPVPGAKPIEMTIPGVDPSEGMVYVPLDSLPPGTVVPMENGADLTAGATLPGNPIAQGNAPAPVSMLQNATTAGVAGQAAVARGDHPGYAGAAPGVVPPQAANPTGVPQPGAAAPQAVAPAAAAPATANGV